MVVGDLEVAFELDDSDFNSSRRLVSSGVGGGWCGGGFGDCPGSLGLPPVGGGIVIGGVALLGKKYIIQRYNPVLKDFLIDNEVGCRCFVTLW